MQNTIVITGASTGIGKVTALWLSARGWRVFAGVRKSADAEALLAADATLIPILLDVTNAEQIAAAVETVTAQLDGNGLQGLFNNAGFALGGPQEFLPVERFAYQMDVNVTGVFAVTQAFLPLIRQAKGRIVNMSSVSGRVSVPILGPYTASKFAVEALSDSLRLELKPHGVWVAIIEPGRIATPIWEKSHDITGKLLDAMPAEMWALYGDPVNTMMDSVANSGGLPPEKVAAKVEHALTATWPRRRYLIGFDAKAGALIAKLPGPLQDWLLRGTY